MNDFTYNTIPVIGISRLRIGTDGPGIRTLVGTYGCGLRCRYCLNPQSWYKDISPIEFTPKELYERIRIDDLYFKSTGGGITFGGGEPLKQIDAIKEFISLCPKEWSMWVETSLNVSFGVEEATEIFDHFIVDIKTLDKKAYHKYTGGNSLTAYHNLLHLRDIVGADRITVRVAKIKGYITDEQRRYTVEELKNEGFTDVDCYDAIIR